MAANKKNNKTGSKARQTNGNTTEIQRGGVSKAKVAKSGKGSEVKIVMKKIVTKVDAIRSSKRATKTLTRVTVKTQPISDVKRTSNNKGSVVKRTPPKKNGSAAKKTLRRRTGNKKATKKSDDHGDWRCTSKKSISKENKKIKAAAATTPSYNKVNQSGEQLLIPEQMAVRSEVMYNLMSDENTYPVPVQEPTGTPHEPITTFRYFIDYCGDMARWAAVGVWKGRKN